jgi:hypothetical protein
MTHCPSRDEVLAHFLDNDGVGGAPGGDPARLAGHLAECGACREALALARRLDALIAATAGSEVDASAAQRVWLGTMESLREPRPRAVSTGRRVVLAAALIAAGFAVALLVQRDRPDPPREAAPPPVAEASPPPEVREDGAPSDGFRPRGIVIPMPSEAVPLRRAARDPRAPSTPHELVRLAERSDLASALRSMVVARAAGMGMPLPGGAIALASACAIELRAAALRELASRADSQGLAAAARILAAEPAGAGLEVLVAAAREVPALADGFARRAASARAAERAFLDAAALVGGARLDAVLRDAVRGDLAATEALAAAASRVIERPGRIALLLGVWSDVQGRGLEAETRTDPSDHAAGESPAEARARRWFARLPRAATAELIDEARRTRSAEQRRRCLLALAARGDDASISYLLELVEGHRRDESELAAHALGRCDAAAVAARALPRIETSRRPELLWAALASCGAEMPDAALRRFDLTGEERSFLHAGAFSLQQFGIAASLFRNRHGPPSF